MNKGNLKVTVVEAKGLKDEDNIGKGDPYVKIILDENNSQSTKPKKGELNPVYNETFNFNVEGQKGLKLEVWDSDPGKDDIIGRSDISLSGVFNDGHDDEWVKIKQHKIGRSKGEVHLTMDFNRIH